MHQQIGVYADDFSKMVKVDLVTVYDLVMQSIVIIYMQQGIRIVLNKMVFVENIKEVAYLDYLLLNIITAGKNIVEDVEIRINIMD